MTPKQPGIVNNPSFHLGATTGETHVLAVQRRSSTRHGCVESMHWVIAKGAQSVMEQSRAAAATLTRAAHRGARNGAEGRGERLLRATKMPSTSMDAVVQDAQGTV